MPPSGVSDRSQGIVTLRLPVKWGFIIDNSRTVPRRCLVCLANVQDLELWERGNSAMAHVSVSKPNGELIFSTNVAAYEFTQHGDLKLNLKSEGAATSGPSVTTSLPYFISSKEFD